MTEATPRPMGCTCIHFLDVHGKDTCWSPDCKCPGIDTERAVNAHDALVAQVAAVEAVTERWFNRMRYLFDNDPDTHQRGIANSYQDLRNEIVEALAGRNVTHTFHPTEFAGDWCECGENFRSEIHTRIPNTPANRGERSKGEAG